MPCVRAFFSVNYIKCPRCFGTAEYFESMHKKKMFETKVAEYKVVYLVMLAV